MSQEERFKQTLDQTLPSTIPAAPLGAIDRLTRSRIRYNMAELAAGEVENVQRWLHQVADGHGTTPANPARAVELFLELLQFSAPKMKAVAVNVTGKDGAVQRLSRAELDAIVSEQ